MTTTLFRHPRIHTLAAESPIDGAIVARDGRIVFVGEADAAREFAGPDAEVVELPGAAVLPAFHDAHIHSGARVLERLGPDLRDTESYAETLELLREWAEEHPGDAWVMGGAWNANPWTDGAPDRRDLDEIFGARPVLLSTIDGHAVWANTAALELAGVTDATADPDGGRIVRDDAGRATGLLLEGAADLVGEHVASVTPGQLADLLDEQQDELLAMGLVQLTDIDDLEVGDAYLQLQREGRLRIRVHKMLRDAELEGAIADGWRSYDGDERLTRGAVKLFSDGALGPHTAHLHEDFEGEPGNSGIAVTDDAELRALTRRAVDAGIAVAVHAIGDRANTRVLDVFEEVADAARAAGLRLRLEHAQHLKPRDIDRIARLGVVASMQPTHCTTDYPLSVQLLGGRATQHYPWRSLLERGVTLAFGSDAPVEPANPFLAIHAAVTRQRRDGEPAGGREPEERISVREALLAHSLGSAFAAGLEHETGTLEVGKFCDFIAVDADPFDADPSTLWRTQVEATIVAGEVAFRR
ncbi:amidohydrolase [Gulosibacter sediminis]|uniref:amidohydrolase n=1 Tax=Gulosibacter sediminis TaxID=1729695 RepID=UPI0024AE85E4|nr:amidohydrolase [Gulosibacter sediminis]